MNARKQVGPAVWLLLVLAHFSPQSWDATEWVPVAGGNLVTDAELASWFAVRPSTVASWRRRLKDAGLLDWLCKPGLGRALFLRGVSQAFALLTQAGVTDPVPKAIDPAPHVQQTEANGAGQQTQGWLN